MQLVYRHYQAQQGSWANIRQPADQDLAVARCAELAIRNGFRPTHSPPKTNVWLAATPANLFQLSKNAAGSAWACPFCFHHGTAPSCVSVAKQKGTGRSYV